MSILQKSNTKASARQQININGVKGNILMLPSNQYRLVLEVSAINFELKSEEEQDVLVDTYESFLNALPCPLEVVIRIRKLDMDNYLDDLKTLREQETEKIYQDQIENYAEFVRSMVADNQILSRRFYVVLPCKATDLDAAKEQLVVNADMVTKGLTRLGMHSRQLDNLELLDLFQSFYNPAQAKQQPIREQVAHLLNNSFIQKERA